MIFDSSLYFINLFNFIRNTLYFNSIWDLTQGEAEAYTFLNFLNFIQEGWSTPTPAYIENILTSSVILTKGIPLRSTAMRSKERAFQKNNGTQACALQISAAPIGADANIKLTIALDNNTNNYFCNFQKSNLSSYLAGLLESDGSIIVPADNITSYKPYIEFVFHIDDLPLAEIIQLNIGGIIRHKAGGENYCLLTVKRKNEVIKIIHLLNGNMRTPKIEALHRIITWCNAHQYGIKKGAEIIPFGLDLSPIQDNNWLSGFIDGDGSFYLNWLYDKKNLPTSLQYYMRISQRQKYHKINDLFDISYFNIMNKISKFLSVPLRAQVRYRKNNVIESLYEVRSANYLANYTILSYLLKYPLFSYKYREVGVQLELLKLSKNKNYKLTNGLKILEELKLKRKGKNLSQLSKNTDYNIHASIYFPFL